MKKIVVFILAMMVVFALPGCAENQKTESTPTVQHEDHQKIETTGQVPEGLKTVIANDLFSGAVAFNGKVLKTITTEKDEANRTVTYMVQMLDLYGKELASYTVTTDDVYHVQALTATADGGFLFVLGFQDRAYDQNTWASENGFASRVIKCDKEGNVQFDAQMDRIGGNALQECFEKDGKFYFFGSIETPETKVLGVGSPSDIYMAILDAAGAVVKTQCIAGSDFDTLQTAEQTGEGFTLSVMSQSQDGDFEGSQSGGYPVEWIIIVNDDLAITEKERGTGRSIFDTRIGEKDGSPVYTSDGLLKNFDAGTPEAFMDYGDFYLIVSENITGEYENTPPYISSIWYYTETVYSGYNNDGKLLFREAVDSTPDYDARVQKWESEVQSFTTP